MRKFCIIAAGSFLSLFAATNAFADPCPAADAGAVLVHGSSASEPLIKAIAKVAAGQGVKVLYNSSKGSCGGGVYEAVTPVTDTTNSVGTWKTVFDAARQDATCTIAEPRAADIGVSDVYASSCEGAGVVTTTLPPGVTDTLGPVQVFTLAVYDDPSFPVAISAAAAFNIFGITANGGDASFNVSPWTVVADIFGRGADSGTWQTWARNLGLKPLRPVAMPATNAPAVLSGINGANRSSAIGILALNDIVPDSSGVAPKVRPLAFKAKDQDFAYYPSSTSTASDLINVRDGHYQTWANLHFFARKDTGGDYSPSVKKVLGLLEGKDAVAAVAKIRAVPSCAMQVSRTADGGDFKLYTPVAPCGCFFEATASGTAPTSCKTCTEGDGSTCGANGQCVFGYCEAK